MSLMAWNCRGIGGASTVHTLKENLQRYRPDLLFLSETKTNAQRCARIARSCRFKDYHAVDAENRAGGLCLFWQDNIEVTILLSNKNMIHVSINHPSLPSMWYLTCVYGPPYEHEKPLFWNQLENLVMNINSPWIMIGDLNEILTSDEKFGGRSLGSCSRNYLENFMNNTGTIDLGFNGHMFTWRNNRLGLAHIRQRLDRAVANDSWKILFPNAGITHLPISNSDHAPIILKLHQNTYSKPYPFRFMEAWTRDPTCKEVINKVWKTKIKGSWAFRFSKKIKCTKMELKRWNKLHFKNCDEMIQEVTKKIEQIQMKDPTT